MTRESNLDARRKAALDQVQKSEQQVKYMFIGIFVWELILITVIILFMDFSDRLHVLIFLSIAIVYGTIAIGLVTLGIYIKQHSLRILQALELMTGRE